MSSADLLTFSGCLVTRYLYGFEEYCRSASITFRTVHHNKPRSSSSSAHLRHLDTEARDASGPAETLDLADEKVEEGPDMKEMKERQMSPRVRHLMAPPPVGQWTGFDWDACVCRGGGGAR